MEVSLEDRGIVLGSIYNVYIVLEWALLSSPFCVLLFCYVVTG